MTDTSQPIDAISPIRSVILRLDPSSSTFTSTHLLLARLCLEARAYSAALPVLDKDIFYFPPITNKAAENIMFPFLSSKHETGSTFMTPDSGLAAKLDYRDHLQYFLFGAMIYMGLKEWKKAFVFLEIVITSPVTNNASKIQVDAYKKWILVGLLHKGHVSIGFTSRMGIWLALLTSHLQSPLMPKTTNPQAAKQYHALGKAYDGLSEVFEKSLKGEETNQNLVAEANQGTQLWSTVSVLLCSREHS